MQIAFGRVRCKTEATGLGTEDSAIQFDEVSENKSVIRRGYNPRLQGGPPTNFEPPGPAGEDCILAVVLVYE